MPTTRGVFAALTRRLLRRIRPGLLGLGLGLVAFPSWAPAAPIPLKPKKVAEPRQFTLKAAQVWRLDCEAPKRFDASALQRLPDGTWLTLDDKSPGLFRIEFNGESARLLPAGMKLLPSPSLPVPRLDVEGLARDDAGRLYVAEESQRWIIRYDPKTQTAERLNIDWQPVKRWFSAEINASWEGIAVGGGKLYVANERSTGRIIVVDLTTLKVERDFQAAPPGVTAADVHYSDLCWHAGDLWVLCRESRCVLRVDPQAEKVLAAFDYDAIERAPQNAYAHPYPYGFVEGLFVDGTDIWLAVDNNGFPRVADKDDRRPQLWRCPRPDVADQAK